jgi:hypothetical protein
MLYRDADEPKNDMKLINIFNRQNGVLNSKVGSKHAWQLALCFKRISKEKVKARRHSQKYLC